MVSRLFLGAGILWIGSVSHSAAAPFSAEQTEAALHALGVPEDGALDAFDTAAFLESQLPPKSERSSSWDWIRRETAEMLRGKPIAPSFVLDLLHARLGILSPLSSQPEVFTAFGPEHAESVLPPLPSKPRGRPVRIAIDPGHMGGSEWDQLTGKFIRESHEPGARQLSEGVLALQVALLLERRLLKRGYVVELTRRERVPVSPLRPADLPLETWAKNTLRQRSWSNWFQGLLPRFAAEGVHAFEQDETYKQLHSDDYRLRYFLNGEDLRARAAKIAAFEPDLTVVIHFDVSVPKKPGSDPHGLNPEAISAVKAYVPGGFFPEELATREDRAWYAFHLLHQQRAHANVTLARSLVQNLALGLGIKPDPNDMGNSMQIESGVFARNLYLTRHHAVSPIAYVETLFYNSPSEFNALYPSPDNRAGAIAGAEYSQRLEQVAASYEQGIVQWVESLP